MTKPAFTPGPWVVVGVVEPYDDKDRENDNSYAEITIPDATTVDGVHHKAIVVHGDNDLANANLIASSPDLYEALDELVSFIKAHVPIFKDNPLIEDADAALARARGETA